MKKITRWSGLIFLITLVILACQQQDQTSDGKEEIKEVKIYQTTDFGKENLDLVVSSSRPSDTEIFQTIEQIIKEAPEPEGVVDVIEPNYYLEMVYEDDSTKELYLWLLEGAGGKGFFMEVEDTNIIYDLSKELETKLIELINSAEN